MVVQLRKLFFVLFCFVCCNGFLLDDRTTPALPLNSGLSDHHYSVIMTVIATEREERLKLEKRVDFLEQELHTSEKGVTELYHQIQEYNKTINEQNHKITSLESENIILKRSESDLQVEVRKLQQNASTTNSKLEQLQKEITYSNQLEVVSKLKTILAIQNETKRLNEELTITNSKVNSIASENKARKEDFMALYSIASETEKKLTLTIQNQTQSITDVDDKIHRLTMLENRTAERLDLELQNMSGRAVLTACAHYKTYSGSEKVLFPFVHTKSGITDSVLTDFGTKGIFRIEKPGLYLVSAYILTSTRANTQFGVYNNGLLIGIDYFSVNGYQTSTIIVAEHLNINDTLYVTTSGMYVHGTTNSKESCLSLIQLTEK